MPSNNTSLYSYTTSGNATIPSNNNTSLYNPGGGPVVPVNGNVTANNVNVSNNVNVGGQVSVVGNITTDSYFIGNGSQLTGIVSTYGNANVAAFLPTYTGNLAGDNLALQGAVAVTGNIATGGYLFGNGSQLSGIDANYGNANVAAFLPTYTGNLAGGNLSVVSTVTGANINSSGGITAQTDISTYANVRTLGAQGNIVGPNYVSANYFVGDGGLLSNISSYSNANVTSLLASFGSNTVSTTGNITAGYFLGNGSQLTGLPEGYGNANVAAFLPVYNGNVNATTVFGQGLPMQGYDYVQMQYSNATALPVTPYDIGTGSWFYLDAGGGVFQSNTTGTLKTITLGNDATINAGGNVTAPYFLGNGSQLTGLPEGYGNANVVTLLANFGSNTISTTGNITAGHITSTANLTVLGNLFSDDITSTGVTVYGDQVITGNLTVQGNTTTINSNVVTTNDKTITVANNQSTGANVDGAGVEAGNPAIASWLYNDLTTSWQSNISITPKSNATQNLGGPVNQWSTIYGVTGEFSGNITGGNVLLGYLLGAGDVTATGNVTGSQIIGNGSQLTNITGANVIGNVANATYATIADSATTAGTVTTNAQPNITSVGILTEINTSGNVSATGNITGNYIIANGSAITGTVANANVAAYLNLSNVDSGSSSQFYIPFTAAGGSGISGPSILEVDQSDAGLTYFPSSGTLFTGVFQGTTVTATGNVIGGNVTTAGQITATGNIRTAGLISAAGTITAAANVNGANLTLTGQNILTTAATLNFGTQAANSTIRIGNTTPIFIGIGPNTTNATIQVGNTTSTVTIPGTIGNANFSGYISALGNITGNYFFGNGSQLTGIVGSSSNSFATMSANGTSIVATSGTDTLTFVPGTNVTITGNATAKSITIASTATSGGDTLSPFLLMGG